MARFIPLSACAALSLAAFAAGPAASAPPPFEDPPFLSSVGGVLAVTLEAGPAQITVAGKTVTANVYNGLYTPPVLRLQQGDTLQVHQVNSMADWKLNVHTHGITTSPQNDGDNVFVTVDPGNTFDNVIPIPAEHPSGLFWYHPHVHMFVNRTIANGMASGLIIGDILAPFPELAGITERVMMLKDLKVRKGALVEDPDPTGSTLRTINGVYKPEITIAPGELQFWRIGNFSADIYYDLVLPGVTFYDIAVDGNLRNKIIATDELVIPPGGRREVLVRGPKAGKYKLKTKKFNTGPDGDHYPAQLMATLVSQGSAVEEIPLPRIFPAVPDLRTESPDVYRTVVFDDTDDPNVFVIDDKVWEESRVDQTVELGALEEWRLQNAAAELHVFHIHQGDFQIIEINGVAQSFTGYQDVVTLPVATKDGPGEVVMRIKFDPPIIVGEYVYHCHIVQHEDQGMMANIVVEDQIAKAMKAADPPDLFAQVLPGAADTYWCGGGGATPPLPAALESRL